ncbi:MAG: response regulator transcription factor [Proteobacteria bacterium]|nr:response regulator transcription factor [Pseudomonadota bacterium]
MPILLIEDDRFVAESVQQALMQSEFLVQHAADGLEGLRLARSSQYQVLVVDRMLPGLDGLRLVKQLRAEDVTTPALFLTTMSGIDDRVHGLEAGGDDYLVKPFAMVELVARVRALARRPAAQNRPTQLRAGGLQLDLLQRSVQRDGHAIELLPLEFKLLEYLVSHAGRVVTRSMLLENVWNIHFDPQTSVVESNMSRLRAKLNAHGGAELIQTIRGTGYRLVASSDAA